MPSPYHILDFDHIQVQIQVAQLTPENLAEHLASESARIRKRVAEERFAGDLRKAVVLVDTSVTLMPDARTRKMQAEWMKEHTDLFRMVVQSMGFVIPSALVRSTLTAVFWLAPMPMPTATHETLEQALDWAITQVDRQGWEVHRDLLREGVMAIERRRAALPSATSARAAPARGPAPRLG